MSWKIVEDVKNCKKNKMYGKLRIDGGKKMIESLKEMEKKIKREKLELKRKKKGVGRGNWIKCKKIKGRREIEKKVSK